MAGQHSQVLIERSQSGQRVDHRFRGRARQVHAAPAGPEERVPGEERPLIGREQADRPFRVPGGVEDIEADPAESDDRALGEVERRDGRRDLERRPDGIGRDEAVAVGDVRPAWRPSPR